MFSDGINKRKLSQRKKFSVVLPTDLSKYDEFRAEITEAFRTLEGVRGIMDVTGLRKTQAYLLAGKFGLIREKAARKTSGVYARRQALNLKHLENVWGWKPGDDNVTLKRVRQYVATKPFHAGKAFFDKGEIFLQYSLPKGKVRECLIAHGVKWFTAGAEKISVESVKGEGTSLSIKLNSSTFSLVACV